MKIILNRKSFTISAIFLTLFLYGCNKPFDMKISEGHLNEVPKNVALLDHSSKTITVAWDYIDGATSYVVQLVTGPDENNPIVSHITHIEDYYIFSNLEPRKEYYARVRANFENSATSKWVYVTLNDAPAKIIPVYGAVSQTFEIPYIKAIDSSSSTITAEWSFTAFDDPDSEVDDTYSLYLYKDAEGKDLVISWEGVKGLFEASTSKSPKPMRFTFSGLQAGKSYYLKVVNESQSLISTLHQFNTTPAIAAAKEQPRQSGDIVLSEDFSKFIHGGDILYRAAGYTVGSGPGRGTYHPATGANPVNTETAQATCNLSTEFNVFDGGNVKSDYTDGVGMNGWGKAGNTSTRPGYIKIGGNKGLASLYTPLLSTINGKANVSISFKVGVYAEAGTPFTGKVLVQTVRGATFSAKGAVTNADKVEIVASELVDIDKAQEIFKTYTVNLNNVTNDTRIVISSNPADLASNKTRFLLDDIIIRVK